jgi:hypothetical protein
MLLDENSLQAPKHVVNFERVLASNLTDLLTQSVSQNALNAT